MQIQTTTFGQEIITEAENVLKLLCFETGKNTSPCIKEIKKSFDEYSAESGVNTNFAKGSDAYCAITVSHILDLAFEKHGIIPSPLRTASAIEFVNLGKKLGLRVDDEPAPGAVLVKNTGGGHHAGLVWFVTDDGYIWTIEGNTYGGVVPNMESDCFIKTQKEGIISRIHPKNKIKYFVHVEEYFPDDSYVSLEVPQFNPSLVGLFGLDDSCATSYDIANDDEESSDNAGKNKWLLPVGIASIIFLYFMLKK